jgi:SAM-dependent methyltransferase
MERAEYERMAALEETMWWYRALHALLHDRLRALRLPDDARVLDAGCGTGGLLLRIRESLPALRPIGVELDVTAAHIAARKSRAPVAAGSVNALPFQGGAFDAIVSADVLDQAGVGEQAILGEFARCLKPGGHLLLNVPAFGWLRSRHDEHVRSARRYTAPGLRRLVEGAGFGVAEVGYWNSLLFPVMVAYRMTAGRTKAQSDVQAFPPWQDRLLHGATVLERRLSARGLRLPFGGSVWMWAVKP